MYDLITLMNAELAITVIIFLLLFIKIGKGISNDKLLSLIQMLVLINLVTGFFIRKEGNLFNGMFHTSPLIILQKNILNLGVWLISLLFSNWLSNSGHMS
jgi:NADH-quinone oxidoreductase subunit N